MKDRYPSHASLDPRWLVSAEDQPEYLDLPGRTLASDSNIAERILRAAPRDAIAVVHHETGEVLTFGDLDRRSGQIANVLRSVGVNRGDRVAFRSGNSPEPILLSLAVWRIGAVIVPTPLAARTMELRFLLEDTEPKLLVAGGSTEQMRAVQDVLADIAIGGVMTWEELRTACGSASPDFNGPRVDAESVAVVWHTGGTTGTPKGCYHTQRRFLLGGYALAQAIGVRPGDRWAAAAPIGHALGFIYHTIFTLLHGATVVTIEDFAQPQVVLGAIAQHKVQTFTAIAASWARMLDTITSEPGLAELPSLKHAFAMWQSASSSQVYDGWKDRGVELLNNFGSTAFATWVLVPRSGEILAPGSLGRPTPGYDVRAVDPEHEWPASAAPGSAGRMAVRGPTGLTYWRQPEFQRRDVIAGWTAVDDLIRFDETGNAAYLGRTDFLISTVGHKVAPVEVEEVLARHSAVREVAVVGLPDPIRHEVVAAFVVLNPGCAADDRLRKELQDLVKRQLSPYKYPRRVEFIDALPRDAVGKVQPLALKERAAKPQGGQ